MAGRRLSCLPVDSKPEPLFHAIKIVVRMQQFVIVDHAECANDHVDRIPNREAAPSEPTIVVRRRKRDLAAGQAGIRKIHEEATSAPIIGISCKSPQYLRENQIAYALERALSLYRQSSADFAGCMHAGQCGSAGRAPMITFDDTAARLPSVELLQV